jgi:glycosyltransferase involved in cell wall biosynthesis
LRVLHLNSRLSGGGTDDRSVRIAHALQQLGLSVWLLGPGGREFSTVAQALGLAFHAAPVGPLKLPFILRTARFVRQQRIQILHARHGNDYWPAILAARLSGARPKVVLSRHLAKSPGSWLSRRFLLSQCDAMLAVSQFVAKVLREGHADPASDNPERHWRPPMRGDLSKIHVVYGGIDMDRFRPGDGAAQRRAWGVAPEHYVFAVAGGYSLPRGKGQPEFLQAAARVKATLPQARFLIIGRGNLRTQLEAQIRQLGLAGLAWLTPYCHDMPAAMNALDCLVLPQVGTEAIPGVIIEAHACGKPVIATDLDGIPEAFAPAGYGQLVPRGDVPALAAAMLELAGRLPLDLPARWQLHARVAAQFSLERAAEQLAALYRSLLARPPGTGANIGHGSHR